MGAAINVSFVNLVARLVTLLSKLGIQTTAKTESCDHVKMPFISIRFPYAAPALVATAQVNSCAGGN